MKKLVLTIALIIGIVSIGALSSNANTPFDSSVTIDTGAIAQYSEFKFGWQSIVDERTIPLKINYQRKTGNYTLEGVTINNVRYNFTALSLEGQEIMIYLKPPTDSDSIYYPVNALHLRDDNGALDIQYDVDYLIMSTYDYLPPTYNNQLINYYHQMYIAQGYRLITNEVGYIQMEYPDINRYPNSTFLDLIGLNTEYKLNRDMSIYLNDNPLNDIFHLYVPYVDYTMWKDKWTDSPLFNGINYVWTFNNERFYLWVKQDYYTSTGSIFSDGLLRMQVSLPSYPITTTDVEGLLRSSYNEGYTNAWFDAERDFQLIFDSLVEDIKREARAEGEQIGYNRGVQSSQQEAYEEGRLIGANESFLANFDKWIVPAIIIVMFVGGFFAVVRMKRDSL